mgnify:CR=1 FL=1
MVDVEEFSQKAVEKRRASPEEPYGDFYRVSERKQSKPSPEGRPLLITTEELCQERQE